MFQVTWHWVLPSLISLLVAIIAMTDGSAASDGRHRIRAFKTDVPIPLDGDLSKWHRAETVTFGRAAVGRPFPPGDCPGTVG